MVQNKKKTPWDYYREGTENPTEKTTPESVKLLNQHYGSAQAGLDENRRLAQEKNNVAYQTAQKYLPIQTKMNGLSGLGVGQSASVDLYNKYATRQGAIDASHASESNDLFKNYMTERNTAQKEHEKKIYDDAVAIIESGSYNSMEELSDYLHANVEGEISDSAYQTILQMYERARLDPENIQRFADEDALRREQANAGLLENYGTSTGASEQSDVVVGDYAMDATMNYSNEKKGIASVTVKTNDGSYDLDIGDKVSDSNIIEASKNVANRSVFSANGEIYFKEGDTVYKIVADDATKKKILGVTDAIPETANTGNPLVNYLINSGLIGIVGKDKN